MYIVADETSKTCSYSRKEPQCTHRYKVADQQIALYEQINCCIFISLLFIPLDNAWQYPSFPDVGYRYPSKKIDTVSQESR